MLFLSVHRARSARSKSEERSLPMSAHAQPKLAWIGGRAANSDITLQFEPSTIVGLLGSNEAGKTTLLRQLVGLSRPTSGHIAVNGRTVIAGRRWVKDFIAYLPQHPLALGDLTVEEAIRSSALLRGQTWSHVQI